MFKTWNVQLIYYKKTAGEFYKLESHTVCVDTYDQVWKEIKKLKDNNCLPGLVGKSDSYIVLAVILGEVYEKSRIII